MSDHTDFLMDRFQKESPVIHIVSSNHQSIASQYDVNEPNHNHTVNLKRDLKARHISMIALGGAVGSGLLIGTGSALATAGPVSCLIAYIGVGLLVYTVMCALGEMATYIPLSDGLAGYGHRYCDRSLGFTMGWSYLLKYVISTANQYVSGALAMQFWISPERVSPAVWITIYIVLVVAINAVGVKYFGEVEFWLCMVKIMVILGLILTLFVIMLGGGPTHDRLGFRYYDNPGAFNHYKDIEGGKGKFVAFVSVLVSAVFAFLGTELVGVTVGEAQNPRRNIPRAIRLTFYRIVVFYIVSVFLLGLCVPYNDPGLQVGSKTTAAASPFVIAIVTAKINVLPHIINAAILLFTFSSANSDLYVCVRTLYGLALRREAPKIFTYTNRFGVPYYSLGICAAITLLAYMAASSSSKSVFNYFVSYVSLFGLLIWASILFTHVRFVKACEAQGVDRSQFAYTAPYTPYSTWVALAFCTLVIFIKNFTVFIEGFDYKTFIAGYLALPIFCLLYVGHRIVTKSKLRSPDQVDLFSFKDQIDEEENQFLEEQANKRIGFYEKYIGWLF